MDKVDKETELAVDQAVDEIDTADMAAEEDQVEELAELTLQDKPAKLPFWRRKKFIISLAMTLLFIAVVFAIPFLRYGIVGTFVHKSVTLKIIDDVSSKPVSGVAVTLGSQDAMTDKNGVARFDSVAVGEHLAKVEKRYYNSWDGTVLVPIFSGAKDSSIKIKATGRTVTVKVLQSITGQPVGDANVVIGDTSAVTNDKGEASVVVAVGSTVSDGKISADHYAGTVFTFDPKAAEDQTVEVKIAPEGRVYYLSKATGVISVMSANLDGSGVKTIVPGTGKEFDQDTAIMASSDWKYLILNANREGKTRLYLITTTDGSVVKIDDDDASYQMAGWVGNSFVYMINRNRSTWQPGQTAIKAYNADARKPVVIDESQASGTGYYDYQSQYLSSVALTTNRVIYGRSWTASSPATLGDKKTQIISAGVDGSKISLKDSNASESIGAVRTHKPNAVYVSQYSPTTNTFSVYDIVEGKLSQSQLDDTALNNADLPTYLMSPNGTKTAWSDMRDGKNLVFTGDANGGSAKQLGLTGYKVYGWMTNAYLLLTKNGSELYIYPVDGSTENPVKITDYHKPINSWMGIGYGSGA